MLAFTERGAPDHADVGETALLDHLIGGQQHSDVMINLTGDQHLESLLPRLDLHQLRIGVVASKLSQKRVALDDSRLPVRHLAEIGHKRVLFSSIHHDFEIVIVVRE